ncbi:hypothetical protein T265_09363 [Opisthorchis viverrini]|uniref:Uncharacterized protein n=1 Tax=Opisthorchis viverrini TaxID=6198 RepID=A0A074Z631_OPIVI|nr:hypothetical protein T265_09363 [Opisthorchis viverrini]KER22601.1 hypothetical protein T265_09363 [Opisthorchis viverrini]
MLDRINTRLRKSFRDSGYKSIFIVPPKVHTQRSDKQTVLEDGSEKPSHIKAQQTRSETQTRSFTGSHHSEYSFPLGRETTPKSLDHCTTARSGPDFGKAISDRMSRLTRSLRVKTGQPRKSDELPSQPRPSKIESLHRTANGELRRKTLNSVPRKSGLLPAPSVLITRRVKTTNRAVQTGESIEELQASTADLSGCFYCPHCEASSDNKLCCSHTVVTRNFFVLYIRRKDSEYQNNIDWFTWIEFSISEGEMTDRKVNGSNSTSDSRLPLFRPGQTGSITALVLPSGGVAARH